MLAQKGRDDLASVILQPDENFTDLVDFLVPLDKKGEVIASDLAKLRTHLQVINTDFI